MSIRRLAIVAVIVAIVLGLCTLACALLSIWTGDPRWESTAVVAGVSAGIALGVAWLCGMAAGIVKSLL